MYKAECLSTINFLGIEAIFHDKKILKAKTWRKRQLTNLLILSKTLFFFDYIGFVSFEKQIKVAFNWKFVFFYS